MSTLSIVIAATCAFLWALVIAPLTSCIFGLPLLIGWRERNHRIRTLGFMHFVLFYGVITFGMAELVFFLGEAFLNWRLSEAWTIGFVPAPFNSGWRILLMFTTSMACGILFGWSKWKKPITSTSSH